VSALLWHSTPCGILVPIYAHLPAAEVQEGAKLTRPHPSPGLRLPSPVQTGQPPTELPSCGPPRHEVTRYALPPPPLTEHDSPRFQSQILLQLIGRKAYEYTVAVTHDTSTIAG
jgi:hypothetical protein